MFKAFLLFLFLSLFQCSLSEYSQPPEILDTLQSPFAAVAAPLPLTYASKTGRAILHETEGGYTFVVNYKNYSKVTGALDDSPQDYRMFPALYTNQVLLMEKCRNFSSYQCSEFDCSIPSNETFNQVFPYFAAQSKQADAKVFMDYNYFSSKSASIVQSCDSKVSDSYGTGAYGMIGLGSSGFTRSAFLNSTIFSIFLEANGKKGEIYFGFDLSHNQKVSPNATFFASENWEVRKDFTIEYGNVKISVLDTTLIFDINADAIGLPKAYYEEFLNQLKTKKEIECETEVYYRPSCKYNGLVKDLPYLNISIEKQNISLPPEYYMEIKQKGEGDDVKILTLFLRGLGSDLTGNSYVTPKYENFTILDRHVLTYYYVLFDATQIYPIISLFIADHQDHTVVYLVLLGIGAMISMCFLFVIFVFCCSSAKVYQGKSAQEIRRKQEDEKILRALEEEDEQREIFDESPSKKEEYRPPSRAEIDLDSRLSEGKKNV